MSWSKYYQKNILSIDKFIGNLYGQKEFIEKIISFKPQKILEVGAGSATLSIFLSYLGFKVTAMDNDKKLIIAQKKAVKFYHATVKIICADAFQLPFKKNDFELIFHQGLLEHFSNQDIEKLIDEQLRVAKIVVFSVPNNHYPGQDFGNERLMSKKQWDKILKKYHLIYSANYSHKFFPKFYLPRTKIHYLAVITRLTHPDLK